MGCLSAGILGRWPVSFAGVGSFYHESQNHLTVIPRVCYTTFALIDKTG